MALQVTGRARIRVLLIVALVIAGFAILLWAHGRRSGSNEGTVNLDPAGQVTGSTAPTTSSPIESPGSLDKEDAPTPANNATPNEVVSTSGFVFTPELIIPVVGVKSEQLLDTFTDARSEERAHDAIDIPAPAGTPVVATADGEIIKLFQSERGGTTIYQLSTDKKLVFYYAHLQRYAEGVVVGKFAKQGEVIGYVGDTGNAGAGNFHLHFSISLIADPKRYWEGNNINPYPLLRK